MEGKRYVGLDCLRGCVIISMILYHATWDIVYLFGVQWSWFYTGFARLWQQSICWTFILLSGFCWHFGKKKVKRGLIVFGSGMLISLATKLFMPTGIIRFGILTFLGSSMLLMLLLDKVLGRIHPVLGAVFSFALFVATRNVNMGYLGFEKWNWIALPQELYANDLTTYLGFMKPGFFSADYFSLLPWLFLFVTGYYLYNLFTRFSLLHKLECPKCRFLAFLGRHSLVIYMLHQIIVYGVLYFFFEII